MLLIPTTTSIKGSGIQSNHDFIHDWVLWELLLLLLFKPRCAEKTRELRRHNEKQKGEDQACDMEQGRSVLVPAQNRTPWPLASASLQFQSKKRRAGSLLQKLFTVSQGFIVMANILLQDEIQQPLANLAVEQSPNFTS